MPNETLGRIHFWVTFLGAHAVFFPMHYLGLQGLPRRYYELGSAAFIPPCHRRMVAVAAAARGQALA